MPITIPRVKAEPPKVVEPAVPAPAMLTQEQVRAMLDDQAASFRGQISAVTQAFSGALAAVRAQPQGKQPTAWDFAVEYRQNGAIESIRATPRPMSDVIVTGGAT
jgi:hypothetical protein